MRNLERAMIPRSVAMKMTGHKTESVDRRCAIVSESDLREAAVKLGALAAGGTETVTVSRRDGDSRGGRRGGSH